MRLKANNSDAIEMDLWRLPKSTVYANYDEGLALLSQLYMKLKMEKGNLCWHLATLSYTHRVPS